jgi:hypothetical protein
MVHGDEVNLAAIIVLLVFVVFLRWALEEPK